MPVDWIAATTHVIGPEIILNVSLAVIIYPVVRWLAGRVSPLAAEMLTPCLNTSHAGNSRLHLLRVLIAVAAVVLIGRLWQLQMVAGEKYRLLSDQNRLREVDVAAPRGVIYDRNGEILARNRPSFSVVVIPGDLPQGRRATGGRAANPASSTACWPSWPGRAGPDTTPNSHRQS